MERYKLSAMLAVLLALAAPAMADWEPAERLTEDEAHSRLAYNNARAIAAAGSQLYVVWYDDRDGNNEIYYKVKGTLGWGPDTRLTTNDSLSLYPAVATSSVGGGSHVHVAWEDYLNGEAEIFYQRSTNGGMTWTGTRITPDDTFASQYPSIAASSLDVHVVWEDGRDGEPEVHYARSTDGGLNWSATRLTGDDTCVSERPSVAVSGDCVHVAWCDTRGGDWDRDYDIYYKRSTNRGITWGADVRLEGASRESWLTSIACSDSQVHIVWRERDRGGFDHITYYRRSLDNGVTWELRTRLTDDETTSFPSVAASGPHVHVVWQVQAGWHQISYRRSTDSGVTWEYKQQLTNSSLGAHNPSVAVSDSMVHVVWTDERDGNPEIYYMRNTTGNAVGQEVGARAFHRGAATIARGVLELQVGSRQQTECRADLLDISGRKVMDLKPGANDVRHLSPGVYFLLRPSVDGRQPAAARKIIVQQ